MRDIVGDDIDGFGMLIGPRYDSKPTQPKDPGEMSRQEEDELFDATLDRDDVADRIWDMIVDESAVKPEWRREFVRVLFRRHVEFVPAVQDFAHAGRITHKEFSMLVDELVDDESSNTDMGRD